MDKLTFLSLHPTDRVRLKNASSFAQRLETEWETKVIQYIKNQNDSIVDNLFKTLNLEADKINFDNLFIEHFFQVWIYSFRYAQTDVEEHLTIPKAKLANPKTPKALADVLRAYDLFKKGKLKPKKQFKQAQELKKEYLKQVKSVWEKYSKDFREGKIATQELIVDKIKKIAETTVNRAKSIVRTETTNYYNSARKSFYDRSQYITHYLFIAIRDAATSPWCTPLTTDGKRGRSGLVYSKEDPLCAQEMPACHPFCRSEFLPLSRNNPNHLKFINNKAIQRRNNQCYPLIKGWGK